MQLRFWGIFIALINFCTCYSFSQTIDDSISKKQIEKIITYLASDKLRGRVNYTKEQLEAAEFIAAEFSSYGLEPFPGFTNYYQPFRRQLAHKSDGKVLKWNNRGLNDSLFIFLPHTLNSGEKSLDDFIILRVDLPVADSILFYNWNDNSENILLWVNIPAGTSFSNAINKVIVPAGMPASDILIVGVPDEPMLLNFSGSEKLMSNTLYNIVGKLEGRSKPNEVIIFSAHYDHIDKRQEFTSNGRVYEETGPFNGANDDASGTTAVLALARYFSMRKDNERTTIFCLFAGEELGLLGSKVFVNYVDPLSIKAVINIEMIGMTNATGKNAFMVTGASYSNLETILRQNLKKEKIKVIPLYDDPSQLFKRSDNYSFAQQGIPAHTLMCSDDKEPCYHQTCDDVNRIDMNNMTKVIQSIAKGCASLIKGDDTPTRIK